VEATGDQDGEVTAADEGVGDAAEEEGLEVGEAAGADQDQVGAPVLRGSGDGKGKVTAGELPALGLETLAAKPAESGDGELVGGLGDLEVGAGSGVEDDPTEGVEDEDGLGTGELVELVEDGFEVFVVADGEGQATEWAMGEVGRVGHDQGGGVGVGQDGTADAAVEHGAQMAETSRTHHDQIRVMLPDLTGQLGSGAIRAEG
jgi:hypothetical protein